MLLLPSLAIRSGGTLDTFPGSYEVLGSDCRYTGRALIMASNILRTPYMERQTTETRECAVCLNERVDPCRTSCGHFFCEECLRAALKPWNRGRCPLCRSKVSLYDTVKADLTTPLETPAVDTIFGSAFLQNGRPGVIGTRRRLHSTSHMQPMANKQTSRLAEQIRRASAGGLQICCSSSASPVGFGRRADI